MSIPSSRKTLGEIPGLVGVLSGPVPRPRGCRVFQSGLRLQQSVEMLLVEGNKAGAAREGSGGSAPCADLCSRFALVLFFPSLLSRNKCPALRS